jgi:peptidylprolyl isomerase
MRLRRLITFIALPVAAACVDSTTTAPRPAVPIEQTTFAPSLGVDLAHSTKLASGMYYRDIAVGTGAALATGQKLSVRYTGYFVDGTVLAPTDLYSFTLGAGEVIPGWDQGLVGVQVGGRRQLIIPPELAYGPNDYRGVPGNSVLVFTVDVLSAP